MGFDVMSDLPLTTLRHGGGTPLTVDVWAGPDPDGEELIRWRARPRNPFHGRLIRTASGYGFWASDAGWYVIDPSAPRISIEPGDLSLTRELRLFGVPTSVCAVMVGDAAIHASAVEIGDKAVLFGGPSLYGKTTLAAAFAARGHRLLTEDTTRVRSAPRPSVFPGPSAVRLRADIASSISIAGYQRMEMPNGRLALIADTDARGDGRPVLLHSVILLRPGPNVALRPAARVAAARDLFALSFLLPSSEHRASTFRTITDIVASVAVMNLERPLTLDATPSVIRAIERYVAG